MKRLARSPSGLSLIEVLVAVCLLGILILPLLHTYVQSSGGIQLGQSESIILDIGGSFTAQVRLFTPSALVPTAGEVSLTPSPDGKYRIGPSAVAAVVELPPWDSHQMTVSYEIAPLPTMPVTARLILLKIQWNARIGGTRQTTFPVVVAGES